MAKYLDFLSQTTPTAEAIDRIWKGSIDMHIHFAPDPGPVRRFDAYETAAGARDTGMRAIVLKSDHCPTTQTVYTVQRLVPEVRVFGSINIERCTTGGLGDCTAETIEIHARMGCKVLWFPTFDAAYAKRFLPGADEDDGITILDEAGVLKPVVYDILDVVKKYDMVLCNGHLSYPETEALFLAAREKGIDKMVLTHPLSDCIWDAFTMEQIARLADLGAYVEHCYRNCLPLLGNYPIKNYVDAIRTIGPERTILTTDLAQITDSIPAEGMRQYIASMLQFGISEEDLTLMVKRNPARLLGLEEAAQ